MSLQPKWSTEEVIAGCIKQSELITTHGGPVVAIVGEETRDVVLTGATQLREKSRTHTGNQNSKAAETQLQRQRLDDAADYLVNRRQCIESAFTDKATRKEFGLPARLMRNSAKSVTHALALFITGAEKNPEKLKTACIPAENIAKMKQLLKDVEAGEDVQEGAKSTAKVSTTQRNELQCSVEAAMIKVVNAAGIAWEAKPEIVELFRATLPKSRRGKSSRTSETETTYTPSTNQPTETK